MQFDKAVLESMRCARATQYEHRRTVLKRKQEHLKNKNEGAYAEMMRRERKRLVDDLMAW